MRELYEKIRNWIPEYVRSVVGTVSERCPGGVQLVRAARNWLTQNSLGEAPRRILSSLGLSDVDTSSMTNMEKLKFYGIPRCSRPCSSSSRQLLLHGRRCQRRGLADVQAGPEVVRHDDGRRVGRDGEEGTCGGEEGAGGEKKGPKEVTYRGDAARHRRGGYRCGHRRLREIGAHIHPDLRGGRCAVGVLLQLMSLLSGWFDLVAGPGTCSPC